LPTGLGGGGWGRFAPPRSLEKREGCKPRYGFGGEGEDLEGQPLSLHRSDGGQEGGGLALEGLDTPLS
jgi:hypothetical protein